MVKFYTFIVFLFFFNSIVFTSTAQEVNYENPSDNSLEKVSDCLDCPKVKEPFKLPPIPIMPNTGDPKKDSVNYTLAKEKWIDNILNLYGNKITLEQKNKLLEILKNEKLENVIRGKILLME